MSGPTPPRGRIVLAGGSGFLGTSLAADLVPAGYDVVVLSRSPDRVVGGARAVAWDGRSLGDWARELEGAAAVVNLAGRNVNCRYTPRNREQIIGSRVASVAVLEEAVTRCDRPPGVWVQSSTLAIHGDRGDEPLDERSAPGEGFSPDVARAWEGAFGKASAAGARKVVLRISFALGRGSGALATLERLARFGLGGAAGGGRQYFSWVHIADLVRIFRRAIDRPDMDGVYAATAPGPVTNAEFMAELRRGLHRPWSPPVPEWAVRLGAWVMRTEPELALRSRRCYPRRLIHQGFAFEFPDLAAAVADLYG